MALTLQDLAELKSETEIEIARIRALPRSEQRKEIRKLIADYKRTERKIERAKRNLQ